MNVPDMKSPKAPDRILHFFEPGDGWTRATEREILEQPCVVAAIEKARWPSVILQAHADLRAALTTLGVTEIDGKGIEHASIAQLVAEFPALVEKARKDAVSALPFEVRKVQALYIKGFDDGWDCEQCGGYYPRDIVTGCPLCSRAAKAVLETP